MSELRSLSGLTEVLAFTAGRAPAKEYSTYNPPPNLPPRLLRSSPEISAVEFENGDLLVCVAYDEGDYSELTPGDGVQLEFYAITESLLPPEK